MSVGKETYDVPESQLGRIQCALRYAGLDLGWALPVLMTDRLINVEFPQQIAPELPLGDEVELTLTIDDRNPLPRRGCVQSRVDSASVRILSFRLLQSHAQAEELHALLVSAFNVRGAFRVRPDASAPVEATICVAEQGFKQPLRVEDISATGLSGQADVRAEQVLARIQEVVLRILLGWQGEPIHVGARIVGRQLNESLVTYRLAFAEDSALQEREVEKVMRYIMERQRQLAAATIH